MGCSLACFVEKHYINVISIELFTIQPQHEPAHILLLYLHCVPLGALALLVKFLAYATRWDKVTEVAA